MLLCMIQSSFGYGVAVTVVSIRCIETNHVHVIMIVALRKMCSHVCVTYAQYRPWECYNELVSVTDMIVPCFRVSLFIANDLSPVPLHDIVNLCTSGSIYSICHFHAVQRAHSNDLC